MNDLTGSTTNLIESLQLHGVGIAFIPTQVIDRSLLVEISSHQLNVKMVIVPKLI